MKLIIHIFAIMLAIAGYAAQATDTNDWGRPTNGIQMSIRIAEGKDQVKASEAVVLSVRERRQTVALAILDKASVPLHIQADQVAFGVAAIDPAVGQLSAIRIKPGKLNNAYNSEFRA